MLLQLKVLLQLIIYEYIMLNGIDIILGHLASKIIDW